LDFWVQLGNSTEWSLACPGRGMAVDWAALLTSDFTGEVVAGASLVGPAGIVPIGLESGVKVMVDVGAGTCRGAATGTGAKYEVSLHPVASSAKAIAAYVATAILVMRIFFMAA
jgi:uncharacterized membrane protein